MAALFEVTVNALMALVFATAAVGKLRDATTFEGVVANFQLLPEALVRPFARALPWLELLVAVLVWAPGALGVIAQSGGAALLAMFAFAMAVNIRRGRREIDCGCFQTAGRQALAWPLVVRNLGLAGALLAAAAWGAPGGDGMVWANGLAGGLALFLIHLAAGELTALRTRGQTPMKGARA